MDNRTLLQKTGLKPEEYADLVGRKRAWAFMVFKPGVSTPLWLNLMLRYAVEVPGVVEWLKQQKEHGK